MISRIDTDVILMLLETVLSIDLLDDNNFVIETNKMMNFPDETNSISEESTFKMLLASLCISDIDELNSILFDINANREYFK